MKDTENNMDEAAFLKERVRLERDAIALERESFNAERAKLISAATAAGIRFRYLAIFSSVFTVLLCLLAFSGGWACGRSAAEESQKKEREERLTKALSRLGEFSKENLSVSVSTNMPTKTHTGPTSAHGNVSVMVIQ